MKRLVLVLLLALCTGAGALQAADKLKVGFIYVGPVGDFGWSHQHDQARQALQRALEGKVETTYLENVSDGPDADRAIERLARDGCGLIFTTSFGFMDATVKVAKRFPDVKFEHATGYKRAPNLSTYAARFYEGRYIIGQIAARMSKTGIAGYIVSFPIPEVVAGINSFMLGAQSINPNFKVKIIWVSSWYDPGKEADAAKVLIGQGADIMVQHTDSTAPLQIAEEHHIHGFGQASDMIKFAPHAQLTAITDHWNDYYIARAKAVLDGTWKSTDTWEGIGGGMVVMAPFTNMPDDVKAMAEATTSKIASGALHPFTGPITRRDGTTVGEPGKPLPDPEILKMSWYVKGIDDKLP